MSSLIYSILFLYIPSILAIAPLMSPRSYGKTLESFLAENKSDISPECAKKLTFYVTSLLNEEFWAERLFDANGKIPSGNYMEFGNFDECINLEHSNVRGKYCLATVEARENSTIRELGRTFLLGICLVDACAPNEILAVAKGIGYDLNFAKLSCQTKNYEAFSLGAILTLAFFGLVLLLMIASTVYDVLLCKKTQGAKQQIFLAFSVAKNFKFLTKSNSQHQISCLHGMRAISMLCIIYAHKLMNLGSVGFQLLEKNSIIDNYEYTVINDFSAAVETFFVLAGVVMVYSYMNARNRKFNVLLHYLRRYLRLTPVLAAMVLIQSHLLDYLGSGPLWTTSQQGTCQKHWWGTLFYVHNYLLPSTEVCFKATWYLCVDMQLFLISPLILLPLKRWPKMTLIGLGLLTLCSSVSAFLTMWFKELDLMFYANRTSFKTRGDFWTLYYVTTHNRASPWLIGAILGYAIFKVKKDHVKVTINKISVMVLWSLSLCLLCTAFFYSYRFGVYDFNKLEHSLYACLYSVLWSIGLSWVIYACVTGHGGRLNHFLSLPIFEFISKLTYSMYLVHQLIIKMIYNRTRQSLEFGRFQNLCTVWGDIIVSIVAASLFTLAFELPISTIEKFVFKLDGNARNKNTVKLELKENISPAGNLASI